MEIISELLHNTAHSTTYGLIGVAGIFTYMTVIVVTAIYRIVKGEHLDHH